MRRLYFLLPLFVIACRAPEMRSYTVAKETPPPAAAHDNHDGHDHGAPPEGHPPMDNALPEGHPPVSGALPEGHPPTGGGLPEGHPEIGVGMGMDMASAQAAGIAPAPAPDRAVSWSTPKGWTEKPGSGFRYATFVIPGPDGLTADLSVTQLSGVAGGLLGNINRWRGQIGLPALSESELPQESRSIAPAGRPMTFVSHVSADPLIDGKHKRRIMGAIYATPDISWFFKMVGEDGLV
ncbi:MAG: hypothetical protein KA044_05135, partial [Elusimicrobia bacterium]|nr:hypothetical protein [Elusimicrobiota bacterium]